jgi:hypothetical protein
MKRLHMAAAIVLLSGGVAVAQGVNGATAPVGSGTTGPTNPNRSAGPGITPASPEGTVGQGRGADRGNPQDLTNRANPQDLTGPGASNPQGLTR